MSGTAKLYQNGLAALDERRFFDSERQFRGFLKHYPGHVGALNLLAIVLVKMERFAEAEPLITRALELDQSSDVSYYNYGLILWRLGKPKQAIEQFTQALRLNQSVADTWNNRGTVLSDLGRHKAALADFDEAIALDPSFLAAYLNKGRAFAALQRYDDALAAYDKTLALNPQATEAWLGRGAVLAQLGRHDEAFAAYQRAMTIKPDLADAHGGIGNTLRELGRLNEAREAYLKALAIAPRCGEFYYHYANITKIADNNPQLAAMEALCADAAAPSIDRMYAHFALGKAYADIADHERAFRHWHNANAIKRTLTDYDEAAMAAHFAKIEKIFTPAFIESKRGNGDPSPVPIFVLGMPRSGSTLIEQILASHSEVYGAGERAFFHWLLSTAPAGDGKITSYPQDVPGLDGPQFRTIGARYVTELSRLAPQAAHVTDKMPFNFLFVGAIHLALPNAKIIHSVRNSIDTCLSCFSNLFSGTLDFAYDLDEIARYYGRYQRLMAHWHRVLPPGTILDVRYEDVVADLEGQARRLLDHCGLAWDPRCLTFNESARPVRTASASQVRQPIYGHSVERWRAYAPWLGPLLRELEPTAGGPLTSPAAP